MAETTEENETTVPNLPAAEDIALTDLLYLIQGTGADRDRNMTLEQLRDFLQEIFTKLKVIGTGGSATLSNAALNIANGDGSANISADGLYFKYGAYRIDIAYDKITFTDEAHGYAVSISQSTGALEITGGLNVSGIARLNGPAAHNGTTALNGATAVNEDATVATGKVLTVNGSEDPTDYAKSGSTGLATPTWVEISSDTNLSSVDLGELRKGMRVIVWNNSGDGSSRTLTFKGPGGGTVEVTLTLDHGTELVCYDPSAKSFFILKG